MKFKATTFLILTCSLVAVSSQAADDQVGDGFYVGGGLNYKEFYLNKTLDFPPLPTATQYHARTEMNGVRGLVLLGYGITRNQYHLGIELRSELGNSLENNFVGYGYGSAFPQLILHLQEQLHHTTSLLLQPGYAVTPKFLPYLNIGLALSEFTSSAYIDDLQFNANSSEYSAGGQYALGGLIDHHLWGGVLGVGIKTALTDRLGMFVEYDYTRYETMHKTAYDEVIDNNISGTYRPHSSTINLGFTYRLSS